MVGSDPKVTCVVADDHPFFREGVSRGLAVSGQITIVGEAEDGLAALELIRAKQPQVAVLDQQMPRLDGIGVVHAVARDQLPTRVLMLSAVTDSAVVFRALEEGATGYLSKESRASEIVQAVLDVARGRNVLPPELAAGVAGHIRLRATGAVPVLSERELQVLRGFAKGHSIPRIASELFLAPSTVKTHTQRLYEKLGVSDRGAAVAEGLRQGLVE